VRLDALVAGADLAAAGVLIREMRGVAGVEVTAITFDSNAVTSGSLFCAVPGRRADGHRFAGEAVARGAVAILCEHPLDLPVAQVVVDSVRSAMGPLASSFYGNPSASLTVIGVTGTNGKTTTTHLLASVLEAHGWPTAALGTLSGPRTTPEAPELQARLAELREGGTVAVAMEVSSHALDQHRVDAVHFRVGVFTNLSQDHLDYHESMDAYFAAKARLFEPGRTDLAVVNADDLWGRRLAEQLRAGSSPVETFSLRDAANLRLGADGTRFRWGRTEVTLAIGGRFNVANALAAATAARALGVTDDTVAEGLSAVGSVRGRFERIDAGQDFTVIVDYAHTPDGLSQALAAARELVPGRLIVVFGAGGDRDHAKRPLMGEAATRLADLALLTSDNPRGEDPGAIIAEVRAGAGGPGALVIEPDRARAIADALAAAGPGDLVLIAGKGHETGQEIGARTIPFDDAQVARETLARIQRSRRGPQ
jgi:UDP-N-acetylmuramoyl-L-alanyl-D-glutamate--2,6-diaminopimelate ligase